MLRDRLNQRNVMLSQNEASRSAEKLERRDPSACLYEETVLQFARNSSTRSERTDNLNLQSSNTVRGEALES